MIAFHDFSDHIHQLILQAVALRTCRRSVILLDCIDLIKNRGSHRISSSSDSKSVAVTTQTLSKSLMAPCRHFLDFRPPANQPGKCLSD